MFKNEHFGLEIFEKGKISMPFSVPAPWKLSIFSTTKIRVGYVYIEESFDTIFNMGYGSGKSPMGERVKKA